jgi:hypothetical protein
VVVDRTVGLRHKERSRSVAASRLLPGDRSSELKAAGARCRSAEFMERASGRGGGEPRTAGVAFRAFAIVRRPWPAAATGLLRFVHWRRRVAPTSEGCEGTGEMRLRSSGSLGLLGDQRGWPGLAWSH